MQSSHGHLLYLQNGYLAVLIKRTRLSIICFLFLAGVSCGGSGSSDELSDDELNEIANAVNTEKLIGTPFEGLTYGDDLDPLMFLCDEQYRTETITEFPIKIFAALFPAFWEEDIQEGIAIANEAIGFEAYEWTDEWNDTVGIIYRVTNLEDYSGYTDFLYEYFNGKSISENLAADWTIRLQVDGEYLVAHELGHATGLGHYLIDYENNTVSSLDDCDLMNVETSCVTTTLEDYTYMMSMQGQIMEDHLGEIGTFANSSLCDDYEE